LTSSVVVWCGALVPYLDVDGHSVYHEVHGSGDPVLLLHGGFCSIETMRAQIQTLAPEHTVCMLPSVVDMAEALTTGRPSTTSR
jgi:hypothetical protein